MHHLHALDQLVSNTFSSPLASLSAAPEPFIESLDNAVSYALNLRSELLQHALANRDKKQMKVFVQTCQAVCIHMCNKLSWNQQLFLQAGLPKKLVKEVMEKNAKVQETLLTLLKFMEEYFPLYFDKGQLMPVQWAACEAEWLAEQKSLLLQRLPTYLDEHHVEALVVPVETFLKDHRLVLQPYSGYALLKSYVNVLAAAFSEPASGDVITSLMHSFIEVGYGPKEFVFIYLENLKEQARTLSEEHRRNTFINHLTLVEFLPVPGGSALSAAFKALIIKKLKEEINCLGPSHSSMGNVRSQPFERTSLQTPMSVAQLGLFIRLLVESGTIKCDNQSRLLRMIASTFKTSKAITISAESLRIKYYATDPASVSIVKEYVIRMMNRLITYK